jgi:hypothetical protein
VAERHASYVAEFELDDPDSGGVQLWRVGMCPVGPEAWNELVAAHTVKEDAPAAVQDAAGEAFAADVVARTVVWEQWGDDERDRTLLDPGDVAGWPDTLTSDVWAALVEEAFRQSGPEGFEWAVERLRRAPLLALEMAVAHEYRIPHSVLMGWGEDDRALATAHLLEQRGSCHGCGVPRRAMTDPDAAVLEVDGCMWCGVLAQARKEATVEQHPRIQLKRGY